MNPLSSSSSLDAVLQALLESYANHGGVNDVAITPVPARQAVQRILQDLEEVLFPGFFCDQTLRRDDLPYLVGAQLVQLSHALERQITLNMRHEQSAHAGHTFEPTRPATIAAAFIAGLPSLRAELLLDVDALFDGDPAVRSRQEVILAYPGLRAVIAHRIAHRLWVADVRLVARLMGELAHASTGIDIHPGATIGHHFYIDHGTGVVIGETTTIGNHVKLYQGVSLGALSVAKRMQDQRRHPTIEDHVTIYAGATILGGDTVVGHHSVVGGNVWLVRSVPPYSLVEHQAAVRVGSRNATSFDPVI